MVQEFQWSRSLVVILLTMMPKYWGKLSLKLKIQFLFSELWYPLFGMTMLLGLFIPILAVATGLPWVSAIFTEFLAHSIPVVLSIIAIVWYLKFKNLLKPVNSPVMSFEAVIFQLVRWPWALYGSLMGAVTAIGGKSTSFKVTPKGLLVREVLDWKLYFPYVIIILISLIPVFFMPEKGQADGYFFFLILNTTMYWAVLYVLLFFHRKDAKKANQEKENHPSYYLSEHHL